ncbi:hypothetical protein BDV25DRAFT_116266 [Aspergillus avenaceus]|uniref:Zn(2)-C6 fungal-type domain-containing protein n=1 Tax=Aspergillus avenaceus TaxID=36643 RepID=A0A5N6U6T1_ASPAV|nr:hypothetical protein BDV25DRAFT_116266 [Aspergillus avenaceus]
MAPHVVAQHHRPPVRVSLACTPCRSKHLRCDALTPVCSRCHADGKDCVYPKSRRGGRHRSKAPRPSCDEVSFAEGQLPDQGQSVFDPTTSCSAHSDASSISNADGTLISQFYACFHPAHPCVLPQWAMNRHMTMNSGELQLLTSVMQYIGAVYARSVSLAVQKDTVERNLSSLGTVTGFDVQAVLLYSIAIYWGDESKRALELLDKTINMAWELGMNRQSFASEQGMNNPILEESWRRTWWQIYVTDAHIAGSTHTFPFRTSNAVMDVDLPCEETAYEDGDIPRPRTLAEYDMREFAGDDSLQFSSFAELACLTRSLDLVLACRKGSNATNAHVICANLDACVLAWRSLLPPSKKEIMRADGSFDEILFKANMIIHTYMVDVHRQLSTLEYSPVESVAHCAPPPPSAALGHGRQDRQLHTAKVLRSIEQFNDLLTLPTNIAVHTPFIICMIANIVIAQLSACRFVFKGHQLRLARERVRMSMGSLKVLSEFWPMGSRTYQEVGIIAREILGLVDRNPRLDHVTQDAIADVGVIELMNPPPLVSDTLSLDMNFDFCGLFDQVVCD